MILSQTLFAFLIILGIVGGIGSLSVLVSLLIIEKEHEYLVVERERNELENLLKEAQINNLTSQVHPHFLFNSLNTITSLIRLGKNEDAVSSLQAISSLLRYTLRDRQQLVKIKEEIHSVKMYLKIQEMRFGKRLEWEIHCPEKYMDIEIPMLSIQPLVENACIHGIEPNVEGGIIKIFVMEESDKLSINILDNGIGISKHLVKNFNEWKRQGGKFDALGIGITNTYERIKYFYGDQGDLIIEKTSNGTICSILIKEGERYEGIDRG